MINKFTKMSDKSKTKYIKTSKSSLLTTLFGKSSKKISMYEETELEIEKIPEIQLVQKHQLVPENFAKELQDRAIEQHFNEIKKYFQNFPNRLTYCIINLYTSKDEKFYESLVEEFENREFNISYHKNKNKQIEKIIISNPDIYLRKKIKEKIVRDTLKNITPKKLSHHVCINDCDDILFGNLEKEFKKGGFKTIGEYCPELDTQILCIRW